MSAVLSLPADRRGSRMRIADVRVTIFAHPMPPLHGARWGGLQEISLVEVVTDEGIVGYGSARAQGGWGGRAGSCWAGTGTVCRPTPPQPTWRRLRRT